MFETYGYGPIPGADEIREQVLADRLRFETKLAAGIGGLPQNRLATLTYEALIADPVGQTESLYSRLDLGDFQPIRETLAAEVASRRDYRPHASAPEGLWRQRINAEWAQVFATYGYSLL
jgi:hypothetical protein